MRSIYFIHHGASGVEKEMNDNTLQNRKAGEAGEPTQTELKCRRWKLFYPLSHNSNAIFIWFCNDSVTVAGVFFFFLIFFFTKRFPLANNRIDRNLV